MLALKVSLGRMRSAMFLPSVVHSYSVNRENTMFHTVKLVSKFQPVQQAPMFHPVQQASIFATIHFRSASNAKALTVEDVKHDSENQEFTVSLPSMPVAYLRYRQIGPNKVDMFTTVVPPEMEGRGIAKLLAQAAFNFAVENDIQMKLTCWYLAGYLDRHPKEIYLKQLVHE